MAESVLATDRRGFLGSTAILAAGGLLFGDWRPARADVVLPKRKLGRTGLDVTCLAFGSVQLSDAGQRRVLEHAIDQGVNFVHTCPGYTGGKAMGIVGDVMRTRRDKVYLMIKAEPHAVDHCLSVLNTDHIDILIPDSRDMSDAEKERYAKLREAGKIRFAGFASHQDQATRLADCVKAGWREVMLCAYNMDNMHELDPGIHAAVGAGMGIISMKSNRSRGGSYADKVKAILSNPDITCINPGMLTIDQVDSAMQYVCAAVAPDGKPVSPRGMATGGHAVAQANGLAGCTFCSDCAKACPEHIAVMDYLRADLYRERGDGELGRKLVADIPARHSLAACTHCGHCDGACAQHIHVLDVMRSVA
jgi:predicted aldo/keto reductase-like oxidoreductase